MCLHVQLSNLNPELLSPVEKKKKGGTAGSSSSNSCFFFLKTLVSGHGFNDYGSLSEVSLFVMFMAGCQFFFPLTP